VIIKGDCLDMLPTLDADSVDSCVTDPPYGLKFMGKKWDYDVQFKKQPVQMRLSSGRH